MTNAYFNSFYLDIFSYELRSPKNSSLYLHSKVPINSL